MACHSAQVASAASANAASSKASKRKDNRPSSSFVCRDQAMCTRLRHVANICGRRALCLYDEPHAPSKSGGALVTVGEALCIPQGRSRGCSPADHRSKSRKGAPHTLQIPKKLPLESKICSVHCHYCRYCHNSKLFVIVMRPFASAPFIPSLQTTRGSQQGSASTSSLSSSSVSPTIFLSACKIWLLKLTSKQLHDTIKASKRFTKC